MQLGVIYPILRTLMKPLALKILLLITLIATTGFGFILLLIKANSHSPILILAAALFLFGSWGSVVVVDSFIKNLSSS